jgi:hypothetical protein
VELRNGQHGQSSSKAITACVSDARLFCVELVLCGALLGKSTLVPTLFAHLTIDKTHDAALSSIPTE